MMSVDEEFTIANQIEDGEIVDNAAENDCHNEEHNQQHKFSSTNIYYQMFLSSLNPKSKLEEGEISDEEVFESANDIPVNCKKQDRPICRLFKTKSCFRNKCPFRHINSDGSDYKSFCKTFDLSKAQSDFISFLFDVDPKLIERQLLNTWERCIRNDAEKIEAKKREDSEFLITVPDYPIDQLYGVNDDDKTSYSNKALNDNYFKQVLQYLKTGKISSDKAKVQNKGGSGRYFSKKSEFIPANSFNSSRPDQNKASTDDWGDTENNRNNNSWDNGDNVYSSYLKKRSTSSRVQPANNFEFAHASAKSAKIEDIVWSDDSDNEKDDKDAVSAYSVNSSDSDMDLDFKQPKKSSDSKSQNLSRREKLLNQLREAEEAVASSK